MLLSRLRRAVRVLLVAPRFRLQIFSDADGRNRPQVIKDGFSVSSAHRAAGIV
ncbi:MAG: hypothetical protein Q4A74_07765 [Cardiobacteriaceae bacterium]|nr:hypothetical protein [Cardiobacteriaceae bacterium]